MIKKIIFWLFFSFLVCLVALSIWIRVDSTSKLNAIEARLEMAGAAMTIGELLPEPVPEDLNAALLYLELKALDEAYDVRDEVYDRLAEVSEADLSSGEVYRFKISEAEWGIVDELLQDKRLEAQLDLIHRIAARPYFQPDWQYEAGPAMMIPEVGVARMAAELLLIKAAQALRSGDIGTVHQNLQEVIVLSKHAEQCPNLISYLTGIALRGLASMFLEAATVERGSTAGFDPSLWQHAVHDLWQRPMDGERLCMGEIVYEAVIEADADAFEAFNGSPAPKKFAALRLSPVASYFRYDYVFYLEYMEAARGMEGQFYNEYTELSKRLDEQMELARRAKLVREFAEDLESSFGSDEARAGAPYVEEWTNWVRRYADRLTVAWRNLAAETDPSEPFPKPWWSMD